MISIGDFSKSSEIVFERKFIDDDKFPSFIKENNLSAENIIVHCTGRIPCWFSVPICNTDQICTEFHFGKRIFFLSENESNFIGSGCLKRKFYIFSKCSRILPNREVGEGGIPRFESNSRTDIRKTNTNNRSFIR